MQKDKLLKAIGMAYTSNNLITGFKLLEQIKLNKIKFVILSSDMGLAQKKKYIDKCLSRNIECVFNVLTKQELSKACGKDILVAIGLKDENFIKLIKSNL
ncbi:50S ribosomal protein L7 [Mycoplasma capricolum subsp. capripneumoniae]|uniref:Ribosomal protein L7A family protein n=6 Tax=Mycoplasma mycoides group TaxID=656088 RepID=A0A9N7B5Z4_MYCCC|nr:MULTISPECIES: ribosomal L7Ae/L30e/S12e/Gadd45 family protein [Mycoplasma mycoides group]ABC01233.1 ribosomal protein L7A family [Mycoplasma capricolum subsp. capricolum ATCC 27343]ADR24584.1 ribosomal protein L7Ae [Mycoplasma leachii PG50]AJK51373.1 ribosomal protein L7A family protein [Mycoplasma capricolum subsp. capripneumoniae 87001]AOQ22060.1 50S ribosomal protein L7 [Mycoplasma capricolum subsp. capripneumoniae M1601]AQU77453.1 50S ribosomal protein L7 [Mycoplasma capricolum subsp. ca